MSQMVRKQIYLYKQQEAQLKRISEARGISEAEVIRQALEQILEAGAQSAVLSDKSPLEEFIELARSNTRRAKRPYKWNRQEAYKEREQKLMGRLSQHGNANPD
ncbi:MAG: hypothetical protein Fur0043_11240 [Anaerolineales bacterium]